MTVTSMVVTNFTLVKSVMEVSNNGCYWSVILVKDNNGGSQHPGTATLVTPYIESRLE